MRPTPSRLAILLLTGCSGPQYALDPRGPAASSIADLWWLMFALAAVVSVTVTAVLLVGIRFSRRRRRGLQSPEINGRALVWSGGVIVPVIILLTVLVVSFRAGTAVYPAGIDGTDELTIEVTGHQFWWEVHYPQHGITTANEIAIPAGRRVRFLVTAPDVIHSFWIPQLHGKIDMIPGRLNTVWIQADEPGRFRGQCAEFCGASHALMAFWVEALQEDEFVGWLEQRSAVRTEPAEVEGGREVFFSAGCGDCHSTRGEPLPPAFGSPGPDLTYLALRSTLAAGTRPNDRVSLSRWIGDPQRIKPGSRMPGTRLSEQDMEALVDYLLSLR